MGEWRGEGGKNGPTSLARSHLVLIFHGKLGAQHTQKTKTKTKTLLPLLYLRFYNPIRNNFNLPKNNTQNASGRCQIEYNQVG